MNDYRIASISSVHPIIGDDLTLSYGDKVICQNLDIAIPAHHFTVIIGPNGCGKSTLLRALGRLLTPLKGQILLDNKRIDNYPSRVIAKRLALLPQTLVSPDGITVQELVSRGRYPHRSFWRGWSPTDQEAVQQAMELTGISELAESLVDSLSGGQRQRVWIAMTLAQQASILLLDEPTTYLDIAYQIELLDLFKTLNQKQGLTLVTILHDLNLACRYATHLVVMHHGQIVAQGAPNDIITADLIERVFGLACMVIEDPISSTPMIVPFGQYEKQNKSGIYQDIAV